MLLGKSINPGDHIAPIIIGEFELLIIILPEMVLLFLCNFNDMLVSISALITPNKLEHKIFAFELCFKRLQITRLLVRNCNGYICLLFWVSYIKIFFHIT